MPSLLLPLTTLWSPYPDSPVGEPTFGVRMGDWLVGVAISPVSHLRDALALSGTGIGADDDDVVELRPKPKNDELEASSLIPQ